MNSTPPPAELPFLSNVLENQAEIRRAESEGRRNVCTNLLCWFLVLGVIISVGVLISQAFTHTSTSTHTDFYNNFGQYIVSTPCIVGCVTVITAIVIGVLYKKQKRVAQDLLIILMAALIIATVAGFVASNLSGGTFPDKISAFFKDNFYQMNFVRGLIATPSVIAIAAIFFLAARHICKSIQPTPLTQ